MKIANKKFAFFAHLSVPLSFARRYSRLKMKRKTSFPFAFSSLIRTFAPKFRNNMNIEALISQAAGEAVKALYGMDASEKMLQLQKT